ncbi:hypothetical protein JXR93_14370, partial [bacterium]|nr:hypothetical protein [bacterium]
ENITYLNKNHSISKTVFNNSNTERVIERIDIIQDYLLCQQFINKSLDYITLKRSNLQKSNYLKIDRVIDIYEQKYINGEIEWSYENQFFENKIVRKYHSRTKNKLKTLINEIIEYDDFGLLVKVTEIFKNKYIHTTQYIYENGYLIKKIFNGEKDFCVEKYFEYYETPNCKNEDYFDYLNSLIEKSY